MDLRRLQPCLLAPMFPDLFGIPQDFFKTLVDMLPTFQNSSRMSQTNNFFHSFKAISGLLSEISFRLDFLWFIKTLSTFGTVLKVYISSFKDI